MSLGLGASGHLELWILNIFVIVIRTDPEGMGFQGLGRAPVTQGKWTGLEVP